MGEFVNELRVQFAVERLSEDRESLEEIANTAGFADQSHFSRVFKKLVGLTPGAYRSSHRRQNSP